MYAARSGHLAVVDYLLSPKAGGGLDPHVVEAEIWNALHYFCFKGQKIIMARMLGRKVDIELVTMYEKASPQGFACHRRFLNVVALSPVVDSSSSSRCGSGATTGGGGVETSSLSHPSLQPFTKAETASVLAREIKRLMKGRNNQAAKGRFLFRYEMFDGAFDMNSLFLSEPDTPKVVQFPAFDHLAQYNCVGSMFKSYEDRNAFVIFLSSGEGGAGSTRHVLRLSSVSGVQHVVFWLPNESDNLTPRVVVA